MKTLVFGMLALSLAISFAAEDDVSQMLAVLRKDGATVEEKAKACRRLGELGTGDAVPALASLLTDKVLNVYARQSLERIGSNDARTVLRDHLATLEGTQQVAVIQSLGNLRDEASVSLLSGLTKNQENAASRAALRALGQIANPAALDVLMATASDKDHPHNGEAAAACLLAARQESTEPQREALYQAAFRAPNATPAYRAAALRHLLVLANDIEGLVTRLRESKPHQQDAALLAIRDMPSEELADALHPVLEGAETALKVRLLEAFKTCHNAQTAEVVAPLINAQEDAVQTAAMRTLAALNGSRSAPTLLKKLAEPSTADLAFSLLRAFESPEVNHTVAGALSSARTNEERESLIRLLGERRAGDQTEVLLESTQDEEPKVAIAAWRALRHVAGQAHLEALIENTAKEQRNQVTNAALSALVNTYRRTDAPADLLVEALESAPPEKRPLWVRALVSLGEPKALALILQDLGNPEAVAETAAQLGRWPDPAPLGALLETLDKNTDPKAISPVFNAIMTLVTQAAEKEQIPHEGLVPLFKRAQKHAQTLEQKRQFVSALGRLHHREGLALLTPYLKETEVKREAAFALLAMAPTLLEKGEAKLVGDALGQVGDTGDDQLQKRIRNLRRQVNSAGENP